MFTLNRKILIWYVSLTCMMPSRVAVRNGTGFQKETDFSLAQTGRIFIP